jgi:hypothetical protein
MLSRASRLRPWRRTGGERRAGRRRVWAGGTSAVCEGAHAADARGTRRVGLSARAAAAETQPAGARLAARVPGHGGRGEQSASRRCSAQAKTRLTRCACAQVCIDVCADFAGQQDCQTRCVRRVHACADSGRALAVSHGAYRLRPRRRAAEDKKYACREACQVAFSTACDRVRCCFICQLRWCWCVVLIRTHPARPAPSGVPAHRGGRLAELPGVSTVPGRLVCRHLRRIQVMPEWLCSCCTIVHMAASSESSSVAL